MPLGNNIFISSEVCFYAFLGGTSRTTFRTKLAFPQCWRLCLIPDVDKVFPLWLVGVPVIPRPLWLRSHSTCSFPAVIPLPLGTFVGCADTDSGDDARDDVSRFPASLTVNLPFLPPLLYIFQLTWLLLTVNSTFSTQGFFWAPPGLPPATLLWHENSLQVLCWGSCKNYFVFFLTL